MGVGGWGGGGGGGGRPSVNLPGSEYDVARLFHADDAERVFLELLGLPAALLQRLLEGGDLARRLDLLALLDLLLLLHRLLLELAALALTQVGVDLRTGRRDRPTVISGGSDEREGREGTYHFVDKGDVAEHLDSDPDLSSVAMDCLGCIGTRVVVLDLGHLRVFSGEAVAAELSDLAAEEVCRLVLLNGLSERTSRPTVGCARGREGGGRGWNLPPSRRSRGRECRHGRRLLG